MLRIGAIPTALTVAPLLTTPLHAQHPLVRVSLESASSRDIVHRLSVFELDLGMTYVDGEPLGAVRVLPLYRERYLLLTPCENEFAARDSISWAEAASTPLCLLSPAMENRRILDRNFAEAGVTVTPVVETDTVSAIYAHVDTMRLSTVIIHSRLAAHVRRARRHAPGAVAATAAVLPGRPCAGRPRPGTNVGPCPARHCTFGGHAGRVEPGRAAPPPNPPPES